MSRRAIALALPAFVAVAALPALAEDPPKLGWSDSAELSYVQTAGNSKGTTLGFGNKLVRTWERAAFTFKAGGIRTEASAISRVAVGPDAIHFRVDETSVSALTAENYFLNAQYDRKITEHFFWNAGAGWDRNKFAGIQDRYTAFAGVGNVWVDKETVKFKTDYSATYTRRDDVVFNPDRKDKFAGFRFAWDYLHKFGAATTYTNTLVMDENLQESSDWRGDMNNAVAVAMSNHLALKASLRWLYANQPADVAVPLTNPDGPAPAVASVLVPLGKLDTIFTTSLVVNW